MIKGSSYIIIRKNVTDISEDMRMAIILLNVTNVCQRDHCVTKLLVQDNVAIYNITCHILFFVSFSMATTTEQ